MRSPELDALADRLRYPLAVYAVSRALYLVIALADLLVRGGSVAGEVSNWDGKWYLLTVTYGYPHTIWHLQDTLGFLPLFPMVMWVVARPFYALGLGLATSYILAGVITALVTGAIATVLLSRLAQRWWGEAASRRAILFFCLFPGTIVFSMAYSEGVTLTLVAGCLLLLKRKRWLAAGLCAGFATAIAPVALAVVPVCLVASWQEIRARGWTDREARRSLLAPGRPTASRTCCWCTQYSVYSRATSSQAGAGTPGAAHETASPSRSMSSDAQNWSS